MNNRLWRVSRERFFNLEEVRKKSALLPGLGICLVIVFAAHYLAGNVGGPVILYALIIGIALRQVADHPPYIAGLEFCANAVLRIGIIFLGVRITFDQVTDFGFQPLLLLAIVPVTVAFSILLSRFMKLGTTLGIVSGCAVGICGAAAALAVVATLPKDSIKNSTLVLTLLGIATLSTVAMLAYPALAIVLGWQPDKIGLFLGASIHDVSHVVGAGYMVSKETGDAAVLMKMLRVAMLVPAVLVLSRLIHERSNPSGNAVTFPGFLIGFVLMVILVNVNVIPLPSQQIAVDISNISILMAMVAIGVKARFNLFWKAERKIILLLVLNSLFIALMAGLTLTWLEKCDLCRSVARVSEAPPANT